MSVSYQLGDQPYPDHCSSAPALIFRTELLPANFAKTNLNQFVPQDEQLIAWLHNALTLRGWGRVLTISAMGADRITSLRSAWREVVRASTWSDPVNFAGSGPVALGTISFSATSAAKSVLIVPRVLFGRNQAGTWITVCALKGEQLPNISDLLHHPPECSFAEAQPLPHHPRPQVIPGKVTPNQYQQAVAQVSELLRTQQAQKVVLARDLVVTSAQPYSAHELVERLRRDYPSCWTFFIDGLVGASPELLVRFVDGEITSRVLAGTARRSPGMTTAELSRQRDWLLHSPKNRREHEFARASAQQALVPLCTDVSASEQPFVLQLPNVLHLASDFRALPAGDTGALALVNALHPTAAVCGTPTAAAARIITEVEQMDRERYAGPVGWVDWHGEGEWCIALRCGQMDPYGSIRIFGGGGIMPDSSPADELAETEAKLRPMLQALGV